jgi:hypothetical protein
MGLLQRRIIMFTKNEKEILSFIVKQKLEVAKEITKCAVDKQKALCKETEYLLESILRKLG